MKLLTSKKIAGFHGRVFPVVSHDQGRVNINFKCASTSFAFMNTLYPAALQLSPEECDQLIAQITSVADIARKQLEVYQQQNGLLLEVAA